MLKLWGYSSAGRASALQAEGHRFEPCCPHHFFGPLAQLVRALACHARGRGFEPHAGRHFVIKSRLLAYIETSGFLMMLSSCLCSSVGRAGD